MLEARKITKRFGGEAVLQGVNLVVAPREVVGLVGMNGSGKTTLLDVLAGKLRPDSGEIWVDSNRMKPVRGSAAHASVFRCNQEPRLFLGLSVRDNILLGQWILRGDQLSLDSSLSDLPLERPADTLSIGQRRRVILDWVRVRIGRVKYFLLDEPAAGADDALVGLLLDVLDTARRHGCGVLLVEHRDGVLKSACDRIVYLRDGICSTEPPASEAVVVSQPIASPDQLATRAKGARLVVRNLDVARGGARVLNGVSFQAAAGEIVVLTGPNGCGKSTLLRAIYGDPSCTVVGGQILSEDRDISALNLRERMLCGVHFMPQNGALFSSMTVEETLRTSVETMGRSAWDSALTKQIRQELSILDRIWYRKCGLLSGGERRLVSLARILLLKPKIALLDEPLAGIDSKNTKRVVQIIRQLASDGAAIVITEQSALVSRHNANTTHVLGTRVQLGRPSHAFA